MTIGPGKAGNVCGILLMDMRPVGLTAELTAWAFGNRCPLTHSEIIMRRELNRLNVQMRNASGVIEQNIAQCLAHYMISEGGRIR